MLSRYRYRPLFRLNPASFRQLANANNLRRDQSHNCQGGSRSRTEPKAITIMPEPPIRILCVEDDRETAALIAKNWSTAATR